MSEAEEKAKGLALIVYILQAIGFFTGGLLWIAGVIVNYVKRSDVQGTWVASHFDWQIKTFWVSLIGFFIGLVLMLVFIGWLVWIAVGIWCIYRVVKGWLALNDRKELGSGLF